MRSPEFYQGHLDAVSRSFALCIPQLAAPFRQHVALSYLLLRVLDTVEDASFADKLQQQRQFTAFRQFLVKPPTGAQVDAFNAAFPDSINDAERTLLADTGAFLEDAYGLPAAARAVMFCAWSLMLGAAALGQMDGPRQSRRAETMELLGRVADIAQDDEALRRQFATLLPRLPPVRAKEPLPKPEPAEWFVRTLNAPLSERELIDLGAIAAVSLQPAAVHQ